MKKLAMLAGMMFSMPANAAYAGLVQTNQVYESGILVGLFIGFCALIVVAQLVPSMVLLYGILKGLFVRESTKVTAVE